MRTLAGNSSPSASCSTLFETVLACVPGMTNIPFNGRCVISHALSGITVAHVGEALAQRRYKLCRIVLGIAGLAAVDHDRAEVAQLRQKAVLQVATRGIHRQRVEKAQPSFAGTGAILMIAAHHEPRRVGEQRGGRFEEIRIPHVPTIAPGAAGAGRIAFRAGTLAVHVIADMNHQIGARGGRRRGDLRKRPGVGIVARLRRIVGIEATTAVAEHHDPLRIWPRKRQRRAVERGGDRTGGNGNLAATDGELRRLDIGETLPRLGADVHWHGRAIKHHGGTRILGDNADARGTVGAESDPLRQNFALGLLRCSRQDRQRDDDGAQPG